MHSGAPLVAAGCRPCSPWPRRWPRSLTLCSSSAYATTHYTPYTTPLVPCAFGLQCLLPGAGACLWVVATCVPLVQLSADNRVSAAAWLHFRFCLPVLPDTRWSFSHGSRLPGPYYSRRAGRPPRPPRYPCRAVPVHPTGGSHIGTPQGFRGRLPGAWSCWVAPPPPRRRRAAAAAAPAADPPPLPLAAAPTRSAAPKPGSCSVPTAVRSATHLFRPRRPARSALAASLEGSGDGAEEQGRGLVSPAAARGGDVAAVVGASGRLRPLWQPAAPQAGVRRGPPPLGSGAAGRGGLAAAAAAGGIIGGCAGCGTGRGSGASSGSYSALCASAGRHERRRPLRHGGVTQHCAGTSAHDSRWAQLRPAPACRAT